MARLATDRLRHLCICLCILDIIVSGLRRRDERWELKYPAAPMSAKSLAQKASGMSRYEEVTEDGLITAVLQELYQRAPNPHPVLQSMQIAEEQRKKPVYELALNEVSKLMPVRGESGLEVLI